MLCVAQHATHPVVPPLPLPLATLQACLVPLRTRDRLGIAVTVAQSGYMALLLALVRWRPAMYARHRSLLLSSALVWQAAVSAAALRLGSC